MNQLDFFVLNQPSDEIPSYVLGFLTIPVKVANLVTVTATDECIV